MVFMAFFACQPTVEPIQYGSDKCDFCRMTIVDNKFAGEIVTKKGKMHKFDATECMAHFLDQQVDDESKIEMILSTGFDEPGKLVAADSCVFLKSKDMPSPMGAFLNPFHSKSAAEHTQQQNGGEILTWEQVRQEIKNN